MKKKKTNSEPLEDVKVSRLCWKLQSQQKHNTYFAQHVILQRASGRKKIPWCPVFSLVKKRRGSFARTHFSKMRLGFIAEAAAMHTQEDTKKMDTRFIIWNISQVPRHI